MIGSSLDHYKSTKRWQWGVVVAYDIVQYRPLKVQWGAAVYDTIQYGPLQVQWGVAAYDTVQYGPLQVQWRVAVYDLKHILLNFIGNFEAIIEIK